MSSVPRTWLAGVLALSVSASALAQESKSVALAKELSAALDMAKLDAIGTQDPVTLDRFVGALYFPMVQLLVVSAGYVAPQAMLEQISKKNYRDVYLDLSGASKAGTKAFVEDLGGNGLVARPPEGQAFDLFEAQGGQRTTFDGDWNKQGLSEEDYMEAFAAADAVYSEMLSALIAQVKKGA